jgi:hypothetical protein
MDRSPLLHPVGPEPPGVYWLRRLVLLIGVAVLIAGVAYACSAGDDGADRVDAGNGGPTPTATTGHPTPAPVARCRSGVLRVTVDTDEETYPVGSTPRLTAVVRNVSEEPCRLATQPAARVWTISSGPDEVWSTADCPAGDAKVLRRLKPGGQVTYAVIWDGHRSVTGCDSPGDEAQPGTYRLVVDVDRVRGKPVIFHLSG